MAGFRCSPRPDVETLGKTRNRRGARRFWPPIRNNRPNERAQTRDTKRSPSERVTHWEIEFYKWAWVELNYRPHAYQAHEGASKVRHHAGFQRDRSPIRRLSSLSHAGVWTRNGHRNGHTTDAPTESFRSARFLAGRMRRWLERDTGTSNAVQAKGAATAERRLSSRSADEGLL
jgi:hypothetical protein